MFYSNYKNLFFQIKTWNGWYLIIIARCRRILNEIQWNINWNYSNEIVPFQTVAYAMQLRWKDEFDSNIIEALFVVTFLRLDNTCKMRMKCAKTPDLHSIRLHSLDFIGNSTGNECISRKSPQNSWNRSGEIYFENIGNRRSKSCALFPRCVSIHSIASIVL